MSSLTLSLPASQARIQLYTFLNDVPKRKLAFVWNECRSHCVFDIHGLSIHDDHIYCTGNVVLGELPQCCVPGSGYYECVSRLCTFCLYICYLDIYHVNDQVVLRGTLHHQRNRASYPPGLSN